MFFVEEKLGERLLELDGLRYRDPILIPNFRFQLDSGEIGARPREDGQWSELKVGEFWQGSDKYAWLAADVAIPKKWKDRTVVGRFDLGYTNKGQQTGYECLLFLNGSPFQGVDANHQEVFLPNGLAGTAVRLRMRIWSGLKGEQRGVELDHKVRRAEICWLDDGSDDLYFTAKAVLQTVGILQENRPERETLLAVLDRAFLAVDWSHPRSQEFYDSVKEASNRLREGLAEIQTDHPVVVRCIGHAHIDVAWLWRLRHTREKGARTFSTALRMMERYPEYVFLQTQPQLYEYLKSDYPEIYDQIRDRVKEGRWEAQGAMWLEPDCNVPSGESLVRQLLFGTRYFRQEFGVECTYLWLPDVFGYSGALPQILKKAGIDYFLTTKISWNQYNRMPHDSFWWRGIDGSEILAHFITAPSGSWFGYTYNGVIEPAMIQGTWDEYQDKSINRELLLAYGHGDGGGGVTREMLELRRRLQRMPGLPRVETGRVDEYFRDLRKRLEETDRYVHTWDGELYLECHRGTYTSQAHNKLMNRKLELLIRETEWLHSLGCLLTDGWSAYPQSDINEAWKILLRNQFHDIIPGSSIGPVYEDSRVEYDQADRLIQKKWQEGAGALAGGATDGTFLVLNSAPWSRTDLAIISDSSLSGKGRWFDVEDRPLIAQRSHDLWIVEVQELPSMGFSTIRFESEGEAGASADGHGRPFETLPAGIATPHYNIKWSEKGQLVSIYDLRAEREVLASGGRANVFQIFEDKPLRGKDAWGIDIYYQEKMREIDSLEKIEVTENGPLRCVVHFVWSYRDSVVEQDMILYARSRRIDFVTRVDWQERQQLLKVVFPVSVRSTEATYDIQFGNLKRPTHWNTSWDFARFEVPAHQWADLSEKGYGVSLLNDSKYGYDVKDNNIRLTLLKSANFPDPEADRGEHRFIYSLLPHSGDWMDAGTVVEAWQLNNPLSWVKGSAEQSTFSLFRLAGRKNEPPPVMVDAVKRAESEERLVLRVHEYSGGRGSVEIESDLVILSWQECDLMERPQGERFRESTIRVEIGPYEIRTFLVEITAK